MEINKKYISERSNSDFAELLHFVQVADQLLGPISILKLHPDSPVVSKDHFFDHFTELDSTFPYDASINIFNNHFLSTFIQLFVKLY